MKTIKTAELTGPKLDWAVAECEKVRTYVRPYEHTMTGLCILDADLVDMETDDAQELRYSRDWAQGGQILERENISVGYQGHLGVPLDSLWYATNRADACGFGQTPLPAAMRCYVASKLGATVDIPQELLPAEL